MIDGIVAYRQAPRQLKIKGLVVKLWNSFWNANDVPEDVSKQRAISFRALSNVPPDALQETK